MAPAIEILIEDRSGAGVAHELLTRVAAEALGRLGLVRGELGVTLVSEREMAELNHEFMGRTGPTDVLSFPLDEVEAGAAGEVPLLLGDVIICPQVAAAQAKELSLTTEQELCLLLIHGILHIAGYDHEADAGEMQALQDRLVEDLCPGNGK